MIQFVKLAARLGIVAAVPFGVLWFVLISAAYFLLPDGIVVKPPALFIAAAAVAGGLLFGLGLAVPLSLLHWHRFRQIAGPDAPLDLSPVQSRTVDLALDIAAAYRLCAAALLALPARIAGQNELMGLDAKTRASGFSRGEALKITLTPLVDGRTRITIVSRPRTRTTLVDYGRNYENVEKVLTYLSRMAPARSSKSGAEQKAPH
ncbi:MAG: hypothetical protein WCF84_20595 [Anaerolineae bacterium]